MAEVEKLHRVVFRGGRKLFPKPSAFESEIHPSHKTPFCTLGISPCRGQICAGANLQSEKTELHLSILLKGRAHGRHCCLRLHFRADVQQRLVAGYLLWKGERHLMRRNSFIEMAKLHNLSGRITYISSHAKQEYLYEVYATEPDREFWRELAKCNQEEFEKSGTNGKCIEARELMIALPESFINYDHDYLLKRMVDEFKKQYGVECFAALHHNKRKTNLHIHMIFAERKRLEQPVEKTATRNMFYDEQGHHVRTKKEILDGDGNIRKGCKTIKKGEVYERKIFTIKDGRFKQESFLDEAKVFYTALINQMVIDNKDRLSIFDKNGPYLATKKVGKNNPKEEEIKADNEIRMEWNRTVDRAIVSGVSETEIVELKKAEIKDRVKESVEQNGQKPEMFESIVREAVALLERLIAKVMQKVMDFAEKIVGRAVDAVKETP